jgi:pilus assembly protein CpaF
VQAARLSDGSRRVTSITEVSGMEGAVITLQEIFFMEKLGLNQDGKVLGRFRANGIRPRFAEKMTAQGISLPTQMFEEDVPI